MADQEFRDRCARAMGWERGLRFVSRHASTNPCWCKASTPPGCGGPVVEYDEWKPDTDYNQAMMMRDRCRENGKESEYTRSLNNLTSASMSHDWSESDVIGNSFATARQIAEAALGVLEGK